MSKGKQCWTGNLFTPIPSLISNSSNSSSSSNKSSFGSSAATLVSFSTFFGKSFSIFQCHKREITPHRSTKQKKKKIMMIRSLRRTEALVTKFKTSIGDKHRKSSQNCKARNMLHPYLVLQNPSFARLNWTRPRKLQRTERKES